MVLESYAWPGNVRELENAMRHACTFAEDGVIQTDDLPARIVQKTAVSAGGGGAGEGPSLLDHAGKSLKGFLREMEKKYILQTIAEHGGDKEAAAKSLKVSLATLYRKLPDPED
jgi:two-component system response regulator AtoC